MLYNIDDKSVSPNARDKFAEEITTEYKRDSINGAFYSIMRIPKVNSYGGIQYPFVLWPNYPNGGTKSPYEFAMEEDYLVTINCGRFLAPWGMGSELTGIPCGTTIQNSEVLQQANTENSNPEDYVLTIDTNGNLGYTAASTSATTLVQSGIVSAVSGFAPLVVDYQEFGTEEEADSLRQIIGQYANGDYIVITTEGRNGQGGGYFKQSDATRLCISLGLKFAFSLDGGGSVQTVKGKKAITPFYENPYGRRIPTYIVFDGGTSFPGRKSAKRSLVLSTMHNDLSVLSGSVNTKIDDSHYPNRINYNPNSQNRSAIVANTGVSPYRSTADYGETYYYPISIPSWARNIAVYANVKVSQQTVNIKAWVSVVQYNTNTQKYADPITNVEWGDIPFIKTINNPGDLYAIITLNSSQTLNFAMVVFT